MLDDIALFVAIAEAGSLAAAAAREDVPPATVTRRLQALERALGYRLLHRSARGTRLTAEGQQYFEQCRPLVQGLRQATQRLDALLSAPAGHVRVLAPVNLAAGPLVPAWDSFLQQYPQISLELETANALQDLPGSGADLAIRVGKLEDSSLTQKRLASAPMALVAAPAYLARAGRPRRAADLEKHALIVADPLTPWRLRRTSDGSETLIHPQPRFRVNELRVAVGMAAAGHGVLLCPRAFCRDELEDGRLEAVLTGWRAEPRHIYAVWSQQRYLPARVRALVAHLAAHFAAHPM